MPLIPALDAQQIQSLASDIDANGFTTLKNIVSSSDLEQLRAFTDSRASKHPGEYFAYHGEKNLSESLLASFWSDPAFKQLMASLYRHAALQESPSEQIFPVLRCIQGSRGVRESNCFHFDASLVTALIPIYIPVDGEQCGDLMLFPNIRKLRSNVVRNVLEKTLLQNRFSRWLTCVAINRGWLTPTVLKLQPGDIYLFWGYRSLHANQPCSPGLKRATAILHFGDPHSGSTATRLILGMNQGRAARVSAQTRSSPPEPTSP
ncbi:hypothetical protein [Pseudomonas capsici]|uniref:Phytanoyl-CoA dioxygenase n=1 Tax=Pseudomonas capsici TaxID=2810614 RepID=A0ABT3BVL3_9PSED|nr:MULTISPECIES: hypothetical protein [Pseudomonas]MBN6716456.1 hypothetical protein [Pseudomonas capsici]MBN6721467.1 hypothetical protein [Pseudomonas capsici]MBN6726384.1 hypothetical protein [Pseudomonas capsici]MBX8610375.1 hypothetical protein [Pseudomonas cichorii]MBX8615203.1 hypothetical protein [Pseudomonas cichorii]